MVETLFAMEKKLILRIWSGMVRTLALISVAVGLLGFVTPAHAQQDTPPYATLESARLALDRLETTLKQDQLSTEALSEISSVAVQVRDDLNKTITDIAPLSAEMETRLKQLGAAPAADALPEPPALVAEREQLTAKIAALDAELKEARLLALRAVQITQTVTKRRYTAYASELFTRSWSIVDPKFWIQAMEALVSDTRRIVELFAGWRRYVAAEGSKAKFTAVALILLIFVVAAVLGFRRWRRWITPAHPASRFGKALQSLGALIRQTAFEPVFVLVFLQILHGFDFLPSQFTDIANGLVIAVAIGAFGCGVATGVLAPREPNRRLLAFDDHTARVLSRHLVATARLLSVFVFVKVLQKAVYSPPVAIGLASMLFALAIVVVMLHLLFEMRPTAIESDERTTSRIAWVRGVAWLVTVVIVFSMLAGYARLAEILSERLLASIIIAGAFYVLITFSNTLFSDAFSETLGGRAIAANLGLGPRRVPLIGALISGIVRLILLLLAAILILGPWRGTTSHLAGAIQDLNFGLTIGEAKISIIVVFAATTLLIVGIVLTRSARSWLETRILPHTDLEPSLQHSVGMIFGYVGVIASVMIALAALGIDLQKITLVAGALSVGIGFGLQSIVSNFISGLILLAERPIRVGDWIVVKGEEGFVKRIRVRATEVETFERASVMIPNSELISGVVKNWTHGNTLGRITVKVGVSYNSDPEQVRDLLLGVAVEHPFVLKEPPPHVLFMAFGDSALEFELRCIVRDVQQRLVMQSKLNFAVLASFRKAGIDIPFPQRTVHIAGGVAPQSGS